jgi:hypothetical protein
LVTTNVAPTTLPTARVAATHCNLCHFDFASNFDFGHSAVCLQDFITPVIAAIFAGSNFSELYFQITDWQQLTIQIR